MMNGIFVKSIENRSFLGIWLVRIAQDGLSLSGV
jgi:hypothetical protein